MERHHILRQQDAAWVNSSTARAGKRLLDLLVAIPSILLSSPLLGILAAITRLILGSPVLVRQERVGLHKPEFELRKLRDENAIAAVVANLRNLGLQTEARSTT